MSIEGVAAAEPCDHFWMWTSPTGTSEAAKVCMGCSAPSADWLNEIAALRAKVAAVEALADRWDEAGLMFFTGHPLSVDLRAALATEELTT